MGCGNRPGGRRPARRCGAPGALAFSPDGSRLVSGSVYPDNTVRLWDAATGRQIADMRGHKNTIRSVAFGPDGRRIVSASQDQTVWLWDGVTGRPIAPFGGHTESVWNAIFSPDGRRVITASADQTLRLWDAMSGERIAVLRGHKREVVWRGVRGARLPAGVALGRRRVARLGHGAGRAERDPPRARELRLRCGLQPRRHAGGLRGLGRHGAALGCDYRPANRPAATRPQSFAGQDRQFRGLAPRRRPARHRDAAATRSPSGI